MIFELWRNIDIETDVWDFTWSKYLNKNSSGLKVMNIVVFNRTSFGVTITHAESYKL